jgi:tyrosyl-tRNA synthetase
MSVDHLIVDYFELLTDVPDDEVTGIRQSIENRSRNPMEHKLRLGREIVTQFHSPEAAEAAQAEFTRVFSAGEQPADVPEWGLNFDSDPMTVDIVELLASSGLAASRAEARRLVTQGAVEADGARVTDLQCARPGAISRR